MVSTDKMHGMALLVMIVAEAVKRPFESLS